MKVTIFSKAKLNLYTTKLINIQRKLMILHGQSYKRIFAKIMTSAFYPHRKLNFGLQMVLSRNLNFCLYLK